MINFEIHITGTANIHKVAKKFGIKTLQIASLRPDKSNIELLDMTSHQDRFHSLNDCKKFTESLRTMIEYNGVGITRVKIESEPCPEYEHMSLYMETHFKDDSFKYPTSFNGVNYLATDRVWCNTEYQYHSFREKWAGKEIELCLYDTNIYQDKEWMRLYNAKN